MDNYTLSETREAPESTEGLDQLLHQKSRIAEAKLEVLVAEIQARLSIRADNVQRIQRDEELAQYMLGRLGIAANYHLREHRDKESFYRILFDLQQQRRSEEVECWRDIVQVVRDLLVVWEVHEQAHAKALFLNDVGS